MSGTGSTLDLFSTSQTVTEKCTHNAPYLCIPPHADKPGQLMQLCCNDWTCPRCGKMRAKHEYGRIVQGARHIVLTGEQLYFLTLTCPGDMPLEQAEKEYLKNTNRLLTALRKQFKKADKTASWYYASVTERQKRGHPHSHYLTTACPTDAFRPIDDYRAYCEHVSQINAQIPVQMRYTAIAESDLLATDLHSD